MNKFPTVSAIEIDANPHSLLLQHALYSAARKAANSSAMVLNGRGENAQCFDAVINHDVVYLQHFDSRQYISY